MTPSQAVALIGAMLLSVLALASESQRNQVIISGLSVGFVAVAIALVFIQS